MNKTVLQKIHLVNWYGFNNTTIPLSEDLTLISGENECGKSTILDAIKYAYTGDTQFNKATSGGYNTGVGKRNLISYTRCLIDASSGIYARPVEKIPVVYTHIALEYFDQINEHSFVLGVVIETAIDIRGTHWYTLDGKTLDDVTFVYEEKGMIKPYDAAGFQKKHGVAMKNKKEGITMFMQMIGLKLPYQEVPKYQRKLRNIMAYNPAAKIQEFIKESVLEQHNVNFDKLRDAKKNIEQINGSLEHINQELQDLDLILADFDEHDRKALQLKIDDLKLKYVDLVECQREISNLKEQNKKNSITCEDLEKGIIEQDEEIAEIDRVYSETRKALLDLDVSKAIEASKQLIESFEKQLSKLSNEKANLEFFQSKMCDIATQLTELGVQVPNQELLERLTSETCSVSEKQHFIDIFRTIITECRDAMIEKNALLKEELNRIERECEEQNSIIESCSRNRLNLLNVQEQVELIKEINRELKKNGIEEEAHMAYEYVLRLENEDWRNAIEAFLGPHRYAIIVSMKAFGIANSVLDRSKFRYVELVNIRRLMAKELECEKDSVFNLLSVQNEIAARYFMFWLGKIHAVELEKVPDYDNAMSKEGKLSRNMTVTYINTKKLRNYCLGSQAIELNKIKAERKIKELEANEKEILTEQKKLQMRSDYLQNSLSCFKEFNLNAHKEWSGISGELNEEKRHNKKLLEAQKNNAEFMALNERVSVLDTQLSEKKKIRDKDLRLKTVLEAAISEGEKKVKTLSIKENECQKKLEEERLVNNHAVTVAMEEYDRYVTGENPNGGLICKVQKKGWIGESVNWKEISKESSRPIIIVSKRWTDCPLAWNVKLFTRNAGERYGLMICREFSRS